MSCRNLILVLGDQLDHDAAWLEACDPQHDLVLMIEARSESQRVWSHKARTTLFLSAMRHYAAWLEHQGHRVDYVHIDRPEAASFNNALRAAIERNRPRRLRMIEAGEHGVQKEIDQACEVAGVAVERHSDTHFLCSREEFAAWRETRKTLVMEHFYRHMRKRHDILMQDGKPTGGKWNFDQKNRRSFGRIGPGMIPPAPQFTPDAVTTAVIEDVERHFPDNPGRVEHLSLIHI